MELRIALDPALADFFRQFQAATPFTQFEYVEVTFGSADTDKDIVTALRPAAPDNIQYTVVRSDRAAVVYHDQSATRKVWQTGYIILRSSVANANCRILLSVKRN